MASAEQAHLHPLSFPLTHLDRLSSLELALIQFHLDNDDKAFGDTVSEARRIWRRRRRAALDAGELLEGARPTAPSSRRPQPAFHPARAATPATLPPVPEHLRSLVQSLRAWKAGGSEPGPLASHIGSGLRARDPQVYKRHPKISTFKDLQAAAANLGIIERGRGGTAGRDWLRLTEPYRLTDTPSLAPLRVSPMPLPPRVDTSIPLPSPLPPSLFHLANLEFEPHLEDLDLLPTHQLLLLQFRDDLQATGWTLDSDRLWTRIERAFWRRRAAALERGERWSTQLPAGHPLIRELDEPLPPAIASALHVVQVGDLPSDRASNVIALTTLLPAHLQFVCATVSAPTFTATTRTAHVAFRSAKVAAAAQTFFADLQFGPGGTGLLARCLPSSTTSHWRWKDVRPDERLGLWQYHLDLTASHSKDIPAKRSYPVDGIVVAGDRLREEKKPRYEHDHAATEAGARPTRSVHATDPVPLELLASTFPAALLNHKVPRDLLIEHVHDDAWIHRFHADGYMIRASQIYLCFASGSDRRAFGEWVKRTASRYWKKNGLTIKSLQPEDIAAFGWQFRHFSPEWRHRFGYRLADASPSNPTVGELGFGPDAEMGPYELGWFPFEYTQQGRSMPPADFVPPRVTAVRLETYARGESLAARLDAKGRSASVTASTRSAYHQRTTSPTVAQHGKDSQAAHDHVAFPIKEEEDAEMKPSAEELRLAEELANAVRANTLDLGEVAMPDPAVPATRQPAANPAEPQLTGPSPPLLPQNSETDAPVSHTGGSIGDDPVLVHAFEQQSVPSRLRRVTAMELMDFEDELEDFTASAAEAVLDHDSPPLAAHSPPLPAEDSTAPVASTSLRSVADQRVDLRPTDPSHANPLDVALDVADLVAPPSAPAPAPAAEQDRRAILSLVASDEADRAAAHLAQNPSPEGHPDSAMASSTAPVPASTTSAVVSAQTHDAAVGPDTRNVATGNKSSGRRPSAAPVSLAAASSSAIVSANAPSVSSAMFSGDGLAQLPAHDLPERLGLPIKPSFATEVPRDSTLWY
ncbi:hypothetical protein JCM3774_001392 [Rhodotorula dairenensis]